VEWTKYFREKTGKLMGIHNPPYFDNVKDVINLLDL